MWSDYGFEGVFRPENLTRLTRWSIISASAACVSFSAMIWLFRCREKHTHLFTSLTAASDELKVYPKILSDLIEKLHAKGISDAQISAALTHVTPLHSDLSEGVFITDERINERIEQNLFKINSYPKRCEFANRETGEAVGVDIGCTIGSISPRLAPAELGEAESMLRRWGFVIVKNSLVESEVEKLRKSLHLTREPASLVGERIAAMDANISRSRATANRLHLLIRGSKLENLFHSVHASLVPLITRLHCSSSRLMLSDLRLVIVDQAAEKSNWSLFNPRGGFTVIIPLHDRDIRTGTYSLLPGSHLLADKRINIFSRIYMTFQRMSLMPHPVQVTDLWEDGCWRAGDALVLDNRLLVRAQENKLFSSGTYILAKYETSEQAPTKSYFGGKIIFRIANLIETVSKLSGPY